MQNPKMADSESSSIQSGILTVQDVAEYGEEMNVIWDVELNQLDAAKSAFQCQYLTDGQTVIYNEHYGARALATAALRGRRICFALTNAAGRSGSWKGTSLTDCSLAYTHGGKAVDALFPWGTANIMVVLPMELFARQLGQLTGWSVEKAFPPAAIQLAIEETAFHRLEANLRHLLAWGDKALPRGLGHTASEMIIEACYGQFFETGDASPAAWHHFRRAISRIKQKDSPLSFAALALDLGISLRSVEIAFNKCTGITPGAYLRRARLNRVRNDLIVHGPCDASVTDLALRHGFTELGRFAGEYRRLFGESPSHTLKQRSRRDRVLFPALK